MCHQTPLVELIPPGGGPLRLFSRVGQDEAADIVLKQFKPRGVLRWAGYAASRWLDRLLTDEIGDPIARHAIDVRDDPVCAFLGPQRHLATEYCGQLDPTDLDEYFRHDGFVALRRCLENLSPEQIIETIQQSGLRGRGGAGFPTGLKWAKVRATNGEKKYVICNGDEGDPGAFMDRMLLESFPYRIIEGMCIAARAVGATKGSSISGPSIRWPSLASTRRWSVAGSGGYWARACWGAISLWNCRSKRGRGPSSAAKRPRCWPRSRAGEACRGSARPIRPKRGCGACPPRSTTWKRTP